MEEKGEGGEGKGGGGEEREEEGGEGGERGEGRVPRLSEKIVFMYSGISFSPKPAHPSPPIHTTPRRRTAAPLDRYGEI